MDKKHLENYGSKLSKYESDYQRLHDQLRQS